MRRGIWTLPAIVCSAFLVGCASTSDTLITLTGDTNTSEATTTESSKTLTNVGGSANSGGSASLGGGGSGAQTTSTSTVCDSPYPPGPYGPLEGDILSPDWTPQGYPSSAAQNAMEFVPLLFSGVYDPFACAGRRALIIVEMLNNSEGLNLVSALAETGDCSFTEEGVEVAILLVDPQTGPAKNLLFAFQNAQFYPEFSWGDDQEAVLVAGSALPLAVLVNPCTMEIERRFEPGAPFLTELCQLIKNGCGAPGM